MAAKDIKQEIERSLKAFTSGNLRDSGMKLFQALGYITERQAPLSKPTYSVFRDDFVRNEKAFDEKKALTGEWKTVDLLFQLTKLEVLKQISLFDTQKVDNTIIEAYLFFCIELKGEQYPRTALSSITREVNKLFPMPAMILFKHGNSLTLSVINRRLHKRDDSKDVLEKVTVIKDIIVQKPHRAHIEILFDLSFDQLKTKHQFSNFVELHNAWQKTLDTKELNKRFYDELFKWYSWAIGIVRFPQIRPIEDQIAMDLHQRESIIRLLTRLLFCWFLKEKQQLIPENLFDEVEARNILREFGPHNRENAVYYRAILQNLFFATLCVPMNDRRYIERSYHGKNSEYGDQYVFRYQDEFVNSKDIPTLFKNIPFLNGGLFDSLDRKKDANNSEEIRLDGFSSTKNKQAFVPDYIFWGEHKNIDLSKEFDNPKRNKEVVHGIFTILSAFKFTIEENTPLEEDIALDPDLLGRTFENLLASYNPETKTNARKQTGSFYTPRIIVDYMVDETLIGYLLQNTNVGGIAEDRLRKLISYSEENTNFDEGERNSIINAIEQVKILDPACGSGAFPMGILQKLVWILQKIDPKNKAWLESILSRLPEFARPDMRKRLKDENWNYVRKLGVIQQSIYGVDVQPIAIQIAKLRFFISLIVDQKIRDNSENNFGLIPLPNLDFKLVCANTLISAPDEYGGSLALTDDFYESFAKETLAYFSTYEPKEKKKISERINDLVNEKVAEKVKRINALSEHHEERFSAFLAEKNKKKNEKLGYQVTLWNSFPNIFKHESVKFFDIKYFFPEIKDRFDIIIGNPPYISAMELKKMIPEIEYKQLKLGYDSAKGTVDYYIYFFERGIKLLNSGGILAYITPNRYLSASYGEALRKYLFPKVQIKSIMNYSGVKVFEEASTYPIISVFQNTPKIRYEIRVGTVDPEDDSISYREIPSEKLAFGEELIWGFLLNDKLEITERVISQSVSIKKVGKINATSTAGEADDFHKFINEQRGFKLINTGTIDRYRANWGSDFLTDQGCKYLKPYLPKDIGILGRNRYDLYIGPKIILAKIALRTEAFFDRSGDYASVNTNCIHTFSKDFDPRYVLAWVNSKLFQYTFECYFEGLRMAGGYLLYSSPNVNQMYIKAIPNEIQAFFGKVVDYLETQTEDALKFSFFDSLIDAMFYELFFEVEIMNSDCSILQHLEGLPQISAGLDKGERIAIVEDVYQTLSKNTHPVSISIFKMDTIEAIKRIEGRK